MGIAHDFVRLGKRRRIPRVAQLARTRARTAEDTLANRREHATRQSLLFTNVKTEPQATSPAKLGGLSRSTADILDFDVSRLPRARDPRSRAVILSFVLTAAVLIALGLSSRTAFDYAGPPIVLLFITIAAFHVLRIYRRSALLRRARFEFIRRLPPARQPAAIARVLTKPLHYDRDDGRKAISMFLAEHGQFGVAYRLQLRPQAAVSPVVAGFEPVAKGDLSAHWLADVAGSHAANPAPRNAPARALWIAWACFGFGALVLVVVPVLMLINMSRSGIAIVPARLVVMTAICATLWTALALFAAILSESWFVVPSGLVRRRLNRLTGRVSLQVFPRPLSVLVLTQHSKRHWAVRVRTGNVNGIFSASDVEATAILRAWLCHASMPTIERVREALG